MKFPKLRVFLSKIEYNVKKLQELCGREKIEIVGVTKGCSAIPEVAKIMVKDGIKTLGDSRIENIKRLRKNRIAAEYMFLRIPMLSELQEVIDYCDISLNSEIETILALEEIAKKSNKMHKIIIMFDLGDLREGFLLKDIDKIARDLYNLRRIKIIGVGTNLGCYGGILYTPEKMKELIEIRRRLESRLKQKIPVISGGSTASLKLIEKKEMPQEINQLRIGEAVLLGQDVTGNRKIPYLVQDTFILQAEIIEKRCKSSVPEGIVGRDAFGNIPEFVDKGVRERSILAIGKQDCQIDSLRPLDKGVKILGASSDHLIVDTEDSQKNYKLGEFIEFQMGYRAMLSLTTSKYVNIEIVD
ncbi:MAG: alanine/ornithine racemase family PLP-dependent enzyme [Candidatus Aerophobetes bacterium]|nr:alanine/ornithine racemase family PLP-dependent enzyme [Candidatus Aerophobetes bacterium]